MPSQSYLLDGQINDKVYIINTKIFRRKNTMENYVHQQGCIEITY